MSAFVVSKTHVAALVKFFGQRELNQWTYGEELMHLEQAADLLMLANVCSVDARYPAEGIADSPVETFTAADIRKAPTLTPVEAIKACHCLAYQSCEHNGWNTSQAKALLDRIENKATHALPGYNEAAWAIGEPAQGQHDPGRQTRDEPYTMGDPGDGEHNRLRDAVRELEAGEAR